MQRLVHLAHQAYASSIYHQPSGTPSSYGMFGSSCPSDADGDLSSTCSSHHRGMHFGRMGSGFPTSPSLPDLVKFAYCYASSGGGGYVFRPPCLRQRWGSGFLTSLPQANVGFKFFDLHDLYDSTITLCKGGGGQVSRPLCLTHHEYVLSCASHRGEFLLMWVVFSRLTYLGHILSYALCHGGFFLTRVDFLHIGHFYAL